MGVPGYVLWDYDPKIPLSNPKNNTGIIEYKGSVSGSSYFPQKVLEPLTDLYVDSEECTKSPDSLFINFRRMYFKSCLNLETF